MTAATRFDPDAHAYYIGERRVPSVTQIIAEVLQPVFWGATEWHLERGRAIHACAALVARKTAFTAEPRLMGYCEAVRKFLDECVTDVWEVERAMYSEVYQFAGTADLVCSLASKGRARILVDYKHSLGPIVEPQLAAYSILDGGTINQGVGVQLCEDGRYVMSKVYDLRRARTEFLALRSAYNVKARMGYLNRSENQKEQAA